MSVLVETTLGDFVIDLFVEERPISSKNFLKLCKMKYYNLNQIFLIEPNYIAQMGDPTNTGRGGESMFGILYGDQARYFEMEMVPKLRHTERGLVSMANNGNNMVGSQFFITLDENLDFLDGKHCVFGRIVEGLDTVTRINEELVDDNNEPYRDLRITHTIILHDPFDDPPRLPSRRSPSPTEDMIRSTTKIALDEKVDETEGKSAEEIKREMEEKEARSQAQILEMVGDLKHADDRPPDNVLFVCKLNPATTSEDLEIIFSRFGSIKCCEVICDRRTGDSLQYAFIEFETPEECEAAYLKMDNTLIDDRRIHVDFSQSVAKNYQWKRQENNGNDAKSDRKLLPTAQKRSDNNGKQRDGGQRYRDDVDLTRSRPRGEINRHNERKHAIERSHRRENDTEKEKNRRREERRRKHRCSSRDSDDSRRGREDKNKKKRDHRDRHEKRRHNRSRSPSKSAERYKKRRD